MKECLHKGHRERLRNRVKKESLINFEDYQVLEYILTFVIPQKDTNPLAHRLINTFGSISKVLEANVEELKKVDGIGDVTAMFLNSYLGVMYHYEKDKSTKDIIIDTPKKASAYFNALLKHNKKEEVYLACLDKNFRLVYTTTLKTGDENKVSITPRNILDIVIRHNASNIIICHNHPNGSPNPSSEDIKFTHDLTLSLILGDIKLLDHIVIGKSGYFSFATSGKLSEYFDSLKELLDKKSITDYYIGKNIHSYKDIYKETNDDKEW